MTGTSWLTKDRLKKYPNKRGLFFIKDSKSDKIIYIGFSEKCVYSAAIRHTQKNENRSELDNVLFRLFFGFGSKVDLSNFADCLKSRIKPSLNRIPLITPSNVEGVWQEFTLHSDTYN